LGAGIGMKSRKWENGFIKNHVTRYVNTTGGNIKALVAFVDGTIPNKSTLF
jgi:hypothetical protein